jgi:hypothetical protein
MFENVSQEKVYYKMASNSNAETTLQIDNDGQIPVYQGIKFRNSKSCNIRGVYCVFTSS